MPMAMGMTMGMAMVMPVVVAAMGMAVAMAMPAMAMTTAMTATVMAMTVSMPAMAVVMPAAFWAAQRHCKVAGIFTRLHLRDGKNAYLRHLPRVLNLLRHRLLDADLSPLRDWLSAQAGAEFGDPTMPA